MNPKISSRRAVVISGEMKAFLESGVSVVVGTRDMGLVPEIVRAWGPVVSEDRRSISLCVAQAASARTLDKPFDHRTNLGRLHASDQRPVDSAEGQVD